MKELKRSHISDSNLRGNPKITTADDVIASSGVISGVSLKVIDKVRISLINKENVKFPNFYTTSYANS